MLHDSHGNSRFTVEDTRSAISKREASPQSAFAECSERCRRQLAIPLRFQIHALSLAWRYETFLRTSIRMD